MCPGTKDKVLGLKVPEGRVRLLVRRIHGRGTPALAGQLAGEPHPRPTCSTDPRPEATLCARSVLTKSGDKWLLHLIMSDAVVLTGHACTL